MKKDEPIVIADGPDIQNIIIQVNFKKSTTSVISSTSAWENMALIMEALKVTAEMCIKDGMNKKEVYQEINRYMTDLFANETTILRHK